MVIDPFPTQEGLSTKPLKKRESEWIIGVTCQSTEAQLLNAEILYYLENGAEALKIDQLNDGNWNDALDKVHKDFIYLDLAKSSVDSNLNINKGAIKNVQSEKLHTKTFSSSKDSLIEELSDIFQEVKNFLTSDPNLVKQLRIETTVNSYMPISISKLRAIRILWLNVLKQLDLDLTPVFLSVNAEAQSEDNNYAMIELSTMAVNAVLGGCDLLYLNGKGI